MPSPVRSKTMGKKNEDEEWKKNLTVPLTLQTCPCLRYDFIFWQLVDEHVVDLHCEACSIRAIWSWIFFWRSLRCSSVKPLTPLEPVSTLIFSSWWVHCPLFVFGSRAQSWQRSKSGQILQWWRIPDDISRAHAAHCWTNFGASRFWRCHNTIIDVCLALRNSSNW